MKENMMEIYARTLQNCVFYEDMYDENPSKYKEKFINEIGCLRGIAYCIESTGIIEDITDLQGLVKYIDIANELMG